MTNLVNQLPESTFGDLITTTNSGQGLPAVIPVKIQDGLGNDSPISMSQTTVNFSRTGGDAFQLDGVDLTVSAQTLNTISARAELLTEDDDFHTIVALNLPTFSSVVPSFISMTASIFAISNFGVDYKAACTINPVTAMGFYFEDGSSIAIGDTDIIFSGDSTISVDAKFFVFDDQLILQVKSTTGAPLNWLVVYQYFTLAE